MKAYRIQRRILRLFAAISRTSRWFEQRFTDAGGLILAGAVGAAIFGIDPRQTFAFQLAAILFAAIGFAIGCAPFWRPKLVVERLLPDTVTVGVPAHYRIAITNRGSRTETGLILADTLRTRYPTVEAFREPVVGAREAGLNWFDRRVGFPRWLDLVRRNRGARLEPSPLPPVRPGETVQVTVSFEPLRRGKIVFEDVRVKRPDPLGIFFAIHRQRLFGTTLSLPQRFPVPRLQWQSERHFHRGGLTLAATVGDSEEFIGLREYRPGDALRHIHWRSFARRGEPVVKEYQDEYFDRHALLIDTYPGNASHGAFETAIAVAASLIQSERPSDSILDLVFINRDVWRMTTGRGLSNNLEVLTQLAELAPSAGDDFEQLADYARRYLDRLASIILVTTAWDSARAAFLAELRQRRLRCIALEISEVQRDPEPSVHTIRPGMAATDLGALAGGAHA